VNPAVAYEPVGEIEDTDVTGFDGGSVARGDLTLTDIAGRSLATPTRYRLEQWILVGPGSHRTHVQVAQPRDRYDVELSVSVLGGIRPVDGVSEPAS